MMLPSRKTLLRADVPPIVAANFMKTSFRFSFLAAFTFGCLLFQSVPGFGQIFAKDDAAGYTNAPGGQNYGWLYNTTTNGGFGFNPWVFQRGGSGFQGFYVGSGGESTDLMSSNKFWGMYANSGSGDNVAVAYRSFTNSLQTNTVFKIKYRPRGIGFSSTQRGGFSLRNGNANSTTNDMDTGFRFEFYYVGGLDDSYRFIDGNGVTATGLGFTRAPFQVEFTLLTPDTYRLVIKDAAGVNTLTNYDNLPLSGSGTIDSVALFALQTDGDQIFNSLEISSTSLVPPDFQNIYPPNGSVYVDASSTNINLDVVSAFSTIASNAIALSLNGVNQTNITVSGTPTNRHVVLDAHLLTNLVYTAVVTALDGNGNRATNTFTFNTWAADCPFIEAEDYNFNSGQFIVNSFPDSQNAYAGLLGTLGIDYLEYDTFGVTNAYRTGDLPQLESAVDVDHAGYAALFLSDYNLAYIKRFEFENYTRVMTDAVYAVYARMAGFGNSPTMLFERLANPTATTSNQPAAALGTFVCPNTGGAQNWTFVPLKDFFSNPVLVRFSGTNTFRTTSLADDGTYNFNYLIFVPVTNSATLRPYLASGFPFSGANVSPDQNISFTIANRQTTANTGTIQVSLNSSNLTSALTLSNNAAGTVVSYQPQFPALLPAGTNTIQVVFSDSGSVSQTNQWQFIVTTLPVIPASYALPLSAAALPGFAVQIAKADDSAPASDFPPTIARAVAHLAGLIIDNNTHLPYPNLAAGTNNGFFDETNTINYEINGIPTANSTFASKTNFPYIAPGSGTNYISMAANMYVQLSAGLNTFVVRSDDGFLLAAGPTAGSTNLYLGLFDAGRGDNTPTTFSFIVQTNGLYPMRLLYDQGEFGANIELYSVKSGQNVLLNDRSNPNGVKVYRTVIPPLVLLAPGHSGTTSTFSFQTENGKAYSVQFATNLLAGPWQTFKSVAGNGAVTNIVDTTATNSTRFYRITTP
jgi:hypothetical protein